MKKAFFGFAIVFASLAFESSTFGSSLRRMGGGTGSNPVLINPGASMFRVITATTSEISASRRHVSKNTKRDRESKPNVYSKIFSTDAINIQVTRAQELCNEIPPEMKGIPISEDPDFSLYCQYHKDPEFLPKIYTAFSHLTGPADNNHDFFKGGFSFQFMVDVEKGENHSKYLYWLMQYRSFMRIKLYQIVPKSDPRREEVCTRATAALFSEEDINSFSSAFVRHMLAELASTSYTPEEFVLSASSNCLMHGYLDGKYFSKDYSDHTIFNAELKELESRIKTNKIEPKNEANETNQKALTMRSAREIGFDEGKKNKRIEIARGMLAKKMDISLIAELTGLTEDEINELK
jgi:hypothetical protein